MNAKNVVEEMLLVLGVPYHVCDSHIFYSATCDVDITLCAGFQLPGYYIEFEHDGFISIWSHREHKLSHLISYSDTVELVSRLTLSLNGRGLLFRMKDNTHTDGVR